MKQHFSIFSQWGVKRTNGTALGKAPKPCKTQTKTRIYIQLIFIGKSQVEMTSFIHHREIFQVMILNFWLSEYSGDESHPGPYITLWNRGYGTSTKVKNTSFRVLSWHDDKDLKANFFFSWVLLFLGRRQIRQFYFSKTFT